MQLNRLFPSPANDLNSEQILESYQPAQTPWVRMNFVSSLDGAVTRDHRSGGLGDVADHHVFELLRRQAHVILVGAGTVRQEGYDAMVLDDEAVTWRVRNGLPPQPVFALISGSLRLDADSSIFTQAPTRPVVYTTATADAERRALLETVADVVQVGEVGVDPLLIKEDLVARGLTHIHGEGGPHVFGSFIEAGAVDELCLTLAPTLEGGSAGRLSASATSAPTNMDLKLVLAAGDELLLRYAKRPADSSA